MKWGKKKIALLYSWGPSRFEMIHDQPLQAGVSRRPAVFQKMLLVTMGFTPPLDGKATACSPYSWDVADT